MRMKAATGIARVSVSETLDIGSLGDSNALQPGQVKQSAQKKTNSRKEPVPKREIIPLEPSIGDDGEETLESLIARKAQLRYVEKAALDAAVLLAYPKPKVMTRDEIRTKTGIKLTPDLWAEIVLRVSEGEALFKICEGMDMPHRATVYSTMFKDKAMQEAYATAIEVKVEKQVESIAIMKREMTERAANGASSEEIRAFQVAINTDQWIVAKMNPKKYGDKQTIDLDAKVSMPESQVDARLAALISKITLKPKADDGTS